MSLIYSVTVSKAFNLFLFIHSSCVTANEHKVIATVKWIESPAHECERLLTGRQEDGTNGDPLRCQAAYKWCLSPLVLLCNVSMTYGHFSLAYTLTQLDLDWNIDQYIHSNYTPQLLYIQKPVLLDTSHIQL